MGWVVMSERELNRVEVLAQVNDGRLSVSSTIRSFSDDDQRRLRPPSVMIS